MDRRIKKSQEAIMGVFAHPLEKVYFKIFCFGDHTHRLMQNGRFFIPLKRPLVE